MVQHVNGPIQITEAGKIALEEELGYLRNVRRPEISDWVMSARDGVKGDLADAAELVQAQREQEMVDSRISELSRILDDAEVIARPASKDVVGLGSTVTFKDEDGIDELTIVGPVEASFKVGRISAESPVGRALMGRRAGEIIEVDTPAGRRSLEIVKVVF